MTFKNFLGLSPGGPSDIYFLSIFIGFLINEETDKNKKAVQSFTHGSSITVSQKSCVTTLKWTWSY